MGFFMIVVMIELVVDISGWRVYVGFLFVLYVFKGKGWQFGAHICLWMYNPKYSRWYKI